MRKNVTALSVYFILHKKSWKYVSTDIRIEAFLGCLDTSNDKTIFHKVRILEVQSSPLVFAYLS